MRVLSDKLKAYTALKELFGVLSVVSLNRLKRAKQEVYPQTPYFRRLEEVLEHLFALNPHNPLFKPRRERRTKVILFGSDLSYTRSLCDKLFKTLEEAEKFKVVEVVVVGEKCKKKYEKLTFLGKVFGKSLNFKRVIEIVNKLFGEYVREEIDRVFILYARPTLRESKLTSFTRQQKKEVEEVPREILYERKTPREVPKITLGEGFSYRIILHPFIPPPIERRYRKGEVLNFEGSEEELIAEVLKIYLNFYVKFLILEHYTTLNLVRFQNTRRIQDNLEREIKKLKRVISKARQDRITRELQDITFALLSFEERLFKDFSHRFAVLEIGKEIENSLKSLIIKVVKKRIPVQEIREVKGLLGFRIITPSEVYDFSVEHYLESLKKNLTLGADLF